ncbi:MAG: iron chaperone [Hyphomonadaceae bacterium]
MANTAHATVDSYLATQPEAAQKVLARVRAALRKALPGAEETISYQIPCYKIAGRVVIYFAGWKEHFSIYPATAPSQAAFAAELAPYAVSKGTIRFPLNKPAPLKLIAALAKFRAQEAAQAVAKAKRKR